MKNYFFITVFLAIAILPALCQNQRDPYKWPFLSTSIWNMPIHNNAVYVVAGLPAVPQNTEWAKMPGIDGEIIILKPTAPLTDIYYNGVGWDGGNRCVSEGGVLLQAPVPTNFIVPNNGENGCAAILAPDGRTIKQCQPFTHCTAGGYATSLCKWGDVDIYGIGNSGSHGGSSLSAVGGSIRLGELRPGQQGPRHVLKVNVCAKQSLYKATTAKEAYRWPATCADGYAVGWYGTYSNNTNFAMRMGALLAIHKNQDIMAMGLETEPARQLAWTLQNYGAYIVDDTYSPAFAFNAEDGPDGSVKAQFEADYGYPMDQQVSSNTPWSRDIQRLIVALYVIDNNDANTIGGGPNTDTINRRQPMACAFGTPGSGMMCPETTGLIQKEILNSMKVYPNPAKGKAIIEYNLIKKEIVQISLFNILGEEKIILVNAEKGTGVHTLDISDYLDNRGIYMIRMKTANMINNFKLINL